MHRILKVKTIPQIGPKCTGSVIVLHGAGGSGPSLRSWWISELGREVQFEHLRVLFPTAVPIHYTPAQLLWHAWIDRVDTDINAPEIIPSIDDAVDSLTQLIDLEVDRGIPLNRIIIGGFSMGGTVALHIGYRSRRAVAGVFAMSSFLNHNSILYSHLDEYNKNKDEQQQHVRLPPLFQSHGKTDVTVHYDWGRETYAQLTKRQVKGEFMSVADCEHELHSEVLHRLDKWITSILPPL
uniref:palmitoyl-protein hydrolase n=1 Tax=Hirondellea gigas TaxID=1518452 RepID=A0A2P2I0D5_9CRUS